nr:uncharacterized protein LOC109730924 [Microcebus murinus]
MKASCIPAPYQHVGGRKADSLSSESWAAASLSWWGAPNPLSLFAPVFPLSLIAGGKEQPRGFHWIRRLLRSQAHLDVEPHNWKIWRQSSETNLRRRSLRQTQDGAVPPCSPSMGFSALEELEVEPCTVVLNSNGVWRDEQAARAPHVRLSPCSRRAVPPEKPRWAATPGLLDKDNSGAIMVMILTEDPEISVLEQCQVPPDSF